MPLPRSERQQDIVSETNSLSGDTDDEDFVEDMVAAAEKEDIANAAAAVSAALALLKAQPPFMPPFMELQAASFQQTQDRIAAGTTPHMLANEENARRTDYCVGTHYADWDLAFETLYCLWLQGTLRIDVVYS